MLPLIPARPEEVSLRQTPHGPRAPGVPSHQADERHVGIDKLREIDDGAGVPGPHQLLNLRLDVPDIDVHPSQDPTAAASVRDFFRDLFARQSIPIPKQRARVARGCRRPQSGCYAVFVTARTASG